MEWTKLALCFWYLYQEALWSNYHFQVGNGEHSSVPPETGGEGQEVLMAKAVYSELVRVLREKVHQEKPDLLICGNKFVSVSISRCLPYLN